LLRLKVQNKIIAIVKIISAANRILKIKPGILIIYQLDHITQALVKLKIKVLNLFLARAKIILGSVSLKEDLESIQTKYKMIPH